MLDLKPRNELFEKLRYYIYPCIAIIGLLIIIDVPAYFRYSMYKEQYLGIYLAMVLAGIFIRYPYKEGANFTVVDMILAILALSVGVYLVWQYPVIVMRMGRPTLVRVTFGAIAILLILEALRRSMGLVLPIICSGFLIYAKFGSVLPGLVKAKPFTLMRAINYLFVDPNSLMQMLGFGAGVGVAFIFFGQILLHYGGGKAFIDFALLFCGKSQGGSAKTAVVASGLVGTITGAPMSNVLLTGSVTIPMMKAAGYPPHIAAAVEAVASSGGQIMPPVMGIAAFIIAETIGVPYAKVALAALIPALLFYFATFVQVHMDAAKLNLKKIPLEQLPKPKSAILNGWFIIPPIVVLLSCMFVLLLPPELSAIIAGFAAIPCMLIRAENRVGFWTKLVGAFRECGELILGIGIVMASAGLIVGCINATGLAFNLSLALVQLGRDNSLLLLICAAVASLVLGMGMPSVAAYSLVAILVAPPLEQFGISKMAAHMFVFYFSVISNITPPVAVSCFAAAPLAGANPNKVGFTAFRLAIAAYIVPFVFCYQPTLVLEGSIPNIIIDTAMCSYAVFAVCIALAGYWQAPVSLLRKVLLVAVSLVILWPTSLLVNLGGVVLLTVLLFPDMKMALAKMRAARHAA